jgi:hypothetical protein
VLVEARAESATLVHGKLRWRVIVLPGADTLPLAAWQNLVKFVRQGGVVIALGALPANSETEFPSARVQAMGKEIFSASGSVVNAPQSNANKAGGAGIFLPRGSESLLPLVLDGLLAPDVKVAEAKSPLRVTHRRLDDREVYFVINDSAKPWAGQVDFAAVGNGEGWNPATGQKEETLAASTSKLSLEPYGAAVFRFASAKLPPPRKASSGALPNLSLRSVPRIEPSTPHGEFVRAELVPDATHSTGAAPAWQANAVLTKSKVDTFLFAQFHYAQPLDLSDADCLALVTWAPDGQSTPNQLLVILHEQDGGDFLVETGRSLAGPGREQTFIPLGRFQLAGWSRDADGVLDLRRVQDIRIGWGGYLGTEGEKVRFSVALPQVGVVTEKNK